MRRIQDNELGTVVDQPTEFGNVEPEIQLLAQLDRHSLRPDEVDHRLVDGKSGIRINDLIPFFDERENAEEDDWFTAGNNDYFFGCHIYPTRLTHALSDALAQL